MSCRITEDLQSNGGVVLHRGYIVHITGNSIMDGALYPANQRGTIGVVLNEVAIGGRGSVVNSGPAQVFMRGGLTLVPGDTLYVSDFFYGHGTNVAPGPGAIAIGILKDVLDYDGSAEEVVLADIFIDSLPIATGSAGGTGMQGATGVQGPTGAPGPQLIRYQFFADQLDNPNNANWAISGLAPVVADTLNNALSVRKFDASVEEGVGFLLRIEPSMTNVNLLITNRPDNVPTLTRLTSLRLYQRRIAAGSGISVAPWTSRNLGTVTHVPSQTWWQEDTFSFAMGVSGPSLAANALYQFELTRINPSLAGAGGGTNLAGDWDLLELHIETT